MKINKTSAHIFKLTKFNADFFTCLFFVVILSSKTIICLLLIFSLKLIIINLLFIKMFRGNDDRLVDVKMVIFDVIYNLYKFLSHGVFV